MTRWILQKLKLTKRSRSYQYQELGQSQGKSGKEVLNPWQLPLNVLVFEAVRAPLSSLPSLSVLVEMQHLQAVAQKKKNHFVEIHLDVESMACTMAWLYLLIALVHSGCRRYLVSYILGVSL